MVRVANLCTTWLVFVLVSSGVAYGQRDAYQAEDEIRRLLADAGRSYNNLELQQANSSVSRALQLVAQFGVQSDSTATLVAQVYVLRGVISYVKDRNTTVAAADFVQALRYDPRASIDPMMSSPSLERVFNQARGQLRTRRDMDRGRSNSRQNDRYQDRYSPPPRQPSPLNNRNSRSGWDDRGDRRGEYDNRYNDRRRDERRGDSEPMRHRRPREAQSNRALRLVVNVSRYLERDIDRLFVFFRTARSQSTQRLEMRRGRNDEFVARIPKRYMVGSTISYYFKAEDRSQTDIESLGTPRKPFRVSISGDLIGSDVMPTGSSLDDASGTKKRRPFFSVGLSIGTGFGWITAEHAKPVRQSPKNAKITESGLALTPFHLLLELDVWIYDWFAIGFFERLQLVEFTHLEGGRFKFRVHRKGDHSLTLRAGGGVGYVRHLVKLDGGQLDTTLEGIGSATFGLSYVYRISSLMNLVISPDYIQLWGASPSYHFDVNIGIGFSF